MTSPSRSPAARPLLDPLDPEVLDDPYPTYARLRREHPVAHLEDHDMWLVTRYADVLGVLRQPTLFSSAKGMGACAAPDADRARTGLDYRIGAPGVRVVLATDPPEHQQFRRAISSAFSSSAIKGLHPEIQRITSACVTDLLAAAGDGTSDFYAHVADPVPTLVLAELLGVPASMRADFRQWAHLVTTELDQVSQASHLGAGIEMFRYFRKEIRARRAAPRDDLFGLLAHAGDAGLTEHEILAYCAFMLVAGIETTTNLLTNVLHAILERADVQRRLRSDPSSIRPAVEEGLRFDSPVQALWRATTTEARIGETSLPAGARVLVSFAAANRDPEKFVNPEELLVDRNPNDHLAFGHGPHFCLGAQLARAEVTAVLNALFDRTSWLVPEGPAHRTHSLLLRGFTELSVRAEP